MAKKTHSDSLIKAGFVILLAYGLFNLANFVYHFMAARMLGPAEYAIVASLFSIVYLISIGSVTLQNVATKFTAEFKAKKEPEKIAYFFRRGLNKLLIFSIVIFAVYCIISPLIANFLKIPLISVLLLGPFLIISVLIPFNRGIMQGMQKFNSLGISLIIEGVIKIIFAFLLIYLGFKANGAIFAAVIGIAVAFIFTFPALKFNNKAKKIKLKLESKEVYRFTLISFIALFMATAIYSIDVFLVKHFFSAEIAGHYAALSLLGKIVFFGATSIGTVMFPKISEMHLKSKGKTRKIFKRSLLFTFIISASITLIYFFFSKLIVSIVFGADYLSIIPLLGYFGIFMLLFSLSYICILNKLATEKKKFIFNIIIALVLEIVLISLFHGSLSQIVYGLITINALLFISLLKPEKLRGVFRVLRNH